PNHTIERAGPPSQVSLTRALAPEHDLGRLQQYHKIEDKALVLDVVKVVLELLERVLVGGAIRVAQLRPARDSRLHDVALVVVRDFFRKPLHELRALGPRPD